MDRATLLRKLLEVDTLDEVRTHLDEFVAAHEASIEWKPVGGRKNNSGTIQAAGDPARSLIERITNGIDAVLERAFQEHHGKPDCRSPREAAGAWFGVPKSGLHKLSNQERRKLAQGSVTLTLSPGDGKAKRTVTVSDHGLGLSSEQMPRTILSLNAENKIDKFYLSGAFGQGGSATFAASDYTLITSRGAHKRDSACFTVVRFDPPQGIKLGSYVYLTVDGIVPETGEIPAEFGDFSTIIKHFGYDLEDYASPLGPNSLYGRSQAILFEPILPFWFENRVHDYSRTIKGSRTALNGAKDEADEDSKLSASSPLFFADLGEYGLIGIEYWVLEPGTKSAPNKAFVNGTKPIVLTVNGQTHAEWGSALLRRDAELMHLGSRMVVHLDCNQLSSDAKRVLFVSNREESRKGLVQNMIREELLGALKADEKLSELEEQARLAGSQSRDETAEREVRREVAKMLRLFGFSASEEGSAAKSGGDKERPTGGGTRPKRPKPEPIQINEPPSMVELVGGNEVAFFPGQRRYLRVRTDAHSKYHDSSDLTKSRFSFHTSSDSIKVSGSSELRDGHMRVVYAASEDAVIDSEGALTVELRPPGRPTLSSSLKFRIGEAPPAKAGGAKVDLPQIDCQAVSEVGEEWISLGWTEDVSEVAADYVYETAKDTLRIRYSTLFPRYKSTYSQIAAKDPVRASSFAKRFEIWLITSVLIHWQDTQADPSTPASSADLDQDSVDEFRRDELRRVVKAAVLYTQREVTMGNTSLDDVEPES